MNEYAGLESKSLEDMVFEEVDPQQEEHFKGSYPGMSTTLSSVYKRQIGLIFFRVYPVSALPATSKAFLELFCRQ